MVCAAWLVAAGRVRELGSSPAVGMPPPVSGSKARSVCRGVAMERVPADGLPPCLLRRSRQGTGIPGCDTGPALPGAAGSTPHMLSQALKNVLMPPSP